MKEREPNIELIKMWIADLRANKKKAVGEMEDAEGGRCCLKVGVDSAAKMGIKINADFGFPDHESWLEAFGFRFDKNITIGEDYCSLDRHNDGDGITSKSHREIASAIEREFIKKEKK